MREHRYKFYLSDETDIDREASSFVQKHELTNPYRASELVRRLIAQGFSFMTMLAKVNADIRVVEDAMEKPSRVESGPPLLLRLNPGDINAGIDVWKSLLSEHNTRLRQQYLRRMFLYGYWLENTPVSSPEKISEVIRSSDHAPAVVTENESIKVEAPKAKMSLGNLMP